VVLDRPVQVAPSVVRLGTEARLRERVQLAIAPLKEATELIVRNHYLHRGRTMAQMAYWIHLEGACVGVLLYAYPRISVKFQGYAPMNLLELARLWIDPAVQGGTIVDSNGQLHAGAVATCAVGHSLRRIRADWQGKYPKLPKVLAVVSWADMERHEGTIYRAANFREVGKSGGRSHGGTERINGGRYYNHTDYSHRKATFLYDFTEGLPPGTVIHASGSIDLVDGALLCHQFGRRATLLDPGRRKSEVVPVHSVTRVSVKKEKDRPTQVRLELHLAADDGECVRTYTDCGPRSAVDRLVTRIRSQRKVTENPPPARKV
jgi:Domain of unknown function (DUF4338)